jgi:hypothetical protein
MTSGQIRNDSKSCFNRATCLFSTNIKMKVCLDKQFNVNNLMYI